jgi:SPP1 gp7 family putative phage head morphogenesis protein
MTYSNAEAKLYNEILEELGGRQAVLRKLYMDAADSAATKIAVYRQDVESGKVISQFAIARQEALLAQINAEIEVLSGEVSKTISDGFSNNYTTTYYTHAYNLEAALNIESALNYDVALNITQLPANAAQAALNAEVAGHTFADRMIQDKIVMQFQVRSAVSRAIIEGQTRKQLSDSLAALDNVYASNQAKAEMTARTELLRAYSYGQDDSRKQAEAAGVMFKYKWDAALDGKTRPDHAKMDGTFATIVDGEPVFTLPDGSKAAGPRMEGLSAKESVNCRCRRLDLPFGIEPTAKSAKLPNGTWVTVPSNTNAEEWIKKNYGEQKSLDKNIKQY